MSVKHFSGDGIEDQKEILLIVNDFDQAVSFLTQIGCRQKAYQESKRELWKLNETEIMIDEWPFLEPLIEIEGPSEEAVKSVAEKLGFDFNTAIFGPASMLYSKKYNITEDRVNNHTPEILFSGKNPFIH